MRVHPALRLGMATVAVNEFIVKQPVRVGDILSFFAKLTRIGRTSITIKVTEASLTYVAIDEAGQPRPLPNPQDSHSLVF